MIKFKIIEETDEDSLIKELEEFSESVDIVFVSYSKIFERNNDYIRSELIEYSVLIGYKEKQ